MTDPTTQRDQSDMGISVNRTAFDLKLDLVNGGWMFPSGEKVITVVCDGHRSYDGSVAILHGRTPDPEDDGLEIVQDHGEGEG